MKKKVFLSHLDRKFGPQNCFHQRFSFEIREAIAAIHTLLEKYITLIDGEIVYKTLSVNEKEYYIAKTFFPHKFQGIESGQFKRKKQLIEQKDIIEELESLEKAEQEFLHLSSHILELLAKDRTHTTTSNLLARYYDEIRQKFSLFQHAIYLEAVKGGYVLSPEEAFHIEKAEEKLSVFGDRSSKDELKWIIDDIEYVLDTELQRSPQDKKLTNHELQILQQVITYLSHQGDIADLRTNFPTQRYDSEETSQNSFPISRSEQVQLYTLLLKRQINKNPSDSWNIVVDNNVNGASSDQLEQIIKIPGKNNAIDIGQAIGTILHEMNAHAITSYNSNKIIPGFRGPNYLSTEEGWASILTALGRGQVTTLTDVEKLFETPSPSMMSAVLAEFYTQDELLEIAKILKKVGRFQADVSQVLRAKRFVHPDRLGGSPKDFAYSRGLRKVYYYLQEASTEQELLEKIRAINTFKVSLEDIQKTPSLIEDIKRENGLEDEDLAISTFDALAFAKNDLQIALQGQQSDQLSFHALVDHSLLSHHTSQELLDVLVGS